MDKNLMYKSILICLFLIFLGINIFVIIPVSGGNEGDTCKKCHAMVPEYTTWQVSNHSQFECKDCHNQPGIKNLIKYQARMVKEFLFYRATDKPKMIVPDKIPDAACKQCHSSNRKVTASSDIIVPHDKHENKVPCITCHEGVAHGRVMERGVTQELNVTQWTADVAVEQMDYQYTTPKMDLCLDCHGHRNVETTCSVCHSNYPVPDSHKPDSWKSGHGIEARQDFKPCNLCHVYTMKKEVNLRQITLFDYIQLNSFCTNCHSRKEPPSHQIKEFKPNHGVKAKLKGTANCFVCHNLTKEEADNGGWSNKVYCNECHWFKEKNEI